MKKALLYITLFLLILSSGGVIPIMLGGVVFFLLMLALLAVTFIAINNYDAGVLKHAGTFLCISLPLLVFLQFLNTRVLIDGEFPHFLFRFFISWLAVMCFSLSRLNAQHMLYRVLQVVGLHALACFFLQFVITPFLVQIELKDILKIHTFLNIFFYESTHELGGLELFRNQGLFWEPGVLTIYMNLLFYMSSFIKKNKITSVVSGFLVLTTFSTTGIILLVMQLLVLYKSIIRKNFVYILPLTLISIPLIPLIVDNITSKFQEDNGSFIVRSYDYLISLSIIRDHWLTGIGFGTEVYEQVQKASSIFQSLSIIDTRRNSNSITALFVAFGIPLSLLALRFLFRQQLLSGNRWLVFLILFLGLNSEPLIFTGFFMFLIVSGAIGVRARQEAPTLPALQGTITQGR